MENLINVYALGESFDVDAFVKTSPITPSLIWRRGGRRGSGTSCYPTSGVTFYLGDVKTVQYPQQERIAIEYLKANRDCLKALGQFPGVTHFTLALQYHNQFQGGFFGTCLGASQQLMWHLLDIGCELSQYVWLEHVDTEDNA